MEIIKPKLTLYRAVTYKITVPGELDPNTLDLDENTIIIEKNDLCAFKVVTMVVTLDQAGLQGLLRRLYYLGLPLISVIWVKSK